MSLLPIRSLDAGAIPAGRADYGLEAVLGAADDLDAVLRSALKALRTQMFSQPFCAMTRVLSAAFGTTHPTAAQQ